MQTAASIAKRRLRIQPNLLSTERTILRTVLNKICLITHAIIFMIWLETPIIHEFEQHIVLYKRFIDDILLIWSGSSAELCRFRERLGNANDNIKLEWQGTPSADGALNPAEFDSIHIARSTSSTSTSSSWTAPPHLACTAYREPGTAYLP
jgi:hypothetical protein